VLIDVAARKYWAFAATNDVVTTKQDVQSMFLPDGFASPALRGLPFGLRCARPSPVAPARGPVA